MTPMEMCRIFPIPSGHVPVAWQPALHSLAMTSWRGLHRLQGILAETNRFMEQKNLFHLHTYKKNPHKKPKIKTPESETRVTQKLSCFVVKLWLDEFMYADGHIARTHAHRVLQHQPNLIYCDKMNSPQDAHPEANFSSYLLCEWDRKTVSCFSQISLTWKIQNEFLGKQWMPIQPRLICFNGRN